MFPEVVVHTEHPSSHQGWKPPAGGGHPPAKFPIRTVPSVLDVVTVVSNPRRFESRYKLYREFARHVQCSGARLTTVELAFGERHYEVTESGNPRHLQLQTTSEIWHKENLIDLGVARLPHDWQYVAWVDADVVFARPEWVAETIHKLQHHPVVQMWSKAVDLGPTNEPIKEFKSFAASYLEELAGGEVGSPAGYGYGSKGSYWHTGFAWAARRDAWDALGGLIDFAILGSADFFMAWALIGRLQSHLYQTIHGKVDGRYTAAYSGALLEWQDRAEELKQDVGCVEGLLLHHFHGSKSKRGYNTREKILIDNAYDPGKHIHRDWQGLYQLDRKAVGLRDQIREYFQRRDEDSKEV